MLTGQMTSPTPAALRPAPSRSGPTPTSRSGSAATPARAASGAPGTATTASASPTACRRGSSGWRPASAAGWSPGGSWARTSWRPATPIAHARRHRSSGERRPASSGQRRPSVRRQHRRKQRTPCGRQEPTEHRRNWWGEPRIDLGNVGPITGRAGAEPCSTDRNYTAGPVRCIGGLCSPAGWPSVGVRVRPETSASRHWYTYDCAKSSRSQSQLAPDDDCQMLFKPFLSPPPPASRSKSGFFQWPWKGCAKPAAVERPVFRLPCTVSRGA